MGIVDGRYQSLQEPYDTSNDERRPSDGKEENGRRNRRGGHALMGVGRPVVGLDAEETRRLSRKCAVGIAILPDGEVQEDCKKEVDQEEDGLSDCSHGPGELHLIPVVGFRDVGAVHPSTPNDDDGVCLSSATSGVSIVRVRAQIRKVH